MPRTKGLFEDFMRRNSWRSYSPSMVQPINSLKLHEYHVFEFDRLLNDKVFSDDPLCEGIQAEVNDRIRADDLCLPFPQTIYTWREFHDEGAHNTLGHWIEPTGREVWRMAIASDTIGDAFFDVLMFEKDATVNAHWILLPCFTRVMRGAVNPSGEVSVQNVLMNDIVVPPSERREAMRDFSRSGALAGGNTALITALLARPGSVLDPFMPTPDSQRLRRARGLRVLPPVIQRVVEFGEPKPRAPRNPEAEPTGETRAPHDRRAHTRKLASGKIVNVKSSKIHGGRSGLVLYDVVDKAA